MITKRIAQPPLSFLPLAVFGTQPSSVGETRQHYRGVFRLAPHQDWTGTTTVRLSVPPVTRPKLTRQTA